MRITKTLLLILFFSIFGMLGYSQTGKLTPDQQKNYKGHAEQMTRMYFSMLNSLADPENPISEKEIIVNESFQKIFRDNKVQVEDDLDAIRVVPLFKDIQAYLRDVDFFFKSASFQFEIQAIDILVNDKNEPYIRVSVNRTIDGISVRDAKAIKNNKIRYIEINIDQAKQELRIASVYTTKINQKEELRTWWNTMPTSWKSILSANIVIKDSLSDTQLRSIAATERIDLKGNQDITDLTPVSKLSNLKSVDISNTKIADLMPLRSLLSLESVKFSNTPVESITPLRYAIHINELDGEGSRIADLSDAINFTALQTLNIRQTYVSDLTLLADLSTIEDLNISKLSVSDLSPLQSMTNLKFLKLADTRVMNISALSSLTKLEIIDLSKTSVQDLTPLKSLPSLKILFMNASLVTDLAPLSGKKLTHIYCDKAPIRQDKILSFINQNPSTVVVYDSETIQKWWTGLAPEVKTLLQQQAGIAQDPSIEELHTIASIKKLTLNSYPNVANLQFVDMLIQLESLDISGTKVTDITPLTKLANLQNLAARNTQISEIASLIGLSKLKTLDLRNTTISNLKTVTKCTALEELRIDSTQVKDLSALLDLTTLKVISADGNNIPESDLYVQNAKGVLLIYKTPVLVKWYDTLSEEWKNTFSKYVKIDSKPSSEQLHKITYLEELSFGGVGISNIEPLRELRRLKILEFKDTQVSDLSPLSNTVSLKSLDCSQNPIGLIDALRQLNQLENLNISNTGVMDISPIENCRKLKVLKLNATKVRRLEPLAGLKALEELEAFNSSIKILKPLFGLKNLKLIKCYNSRTSQKRVDALKKELPKATIIFYGASSGFSFSDLFH
jgi:Leucine-rich repeat (LRR) protein